MVELQGVKNLIFDFGGVILDIDFGLTAKAFERLGVSNTESLIKRAMHLDFFGQFERGKISPYEFRSEMCDLADKQLSHQEFDDAWNEMLLDIPEERVRILENLRKKYRLFLLSNTNKIHYANYYNRVQHLGYPFVDDLFEKAWFSFNIGLAKPGREIFDFILKEKSLNPSECLFVDDMPENIAGAELAGIKGLCIQPGTFAEYFRTKE
ncbi:MAG: hypothetical protein CVU05_03990 [Bacteroidetes bacterium HGW-Bacteroidetes-21]|nr:MAG: hypothetical protein CVU05_03990 [Bacteroidetes bacterium HGW-Bacteroidetes-21]